MCVCTQSIFFLQSSAHRHFHGLAIVTVLLPTVGADSSVTASVFSPNMCPGVGLLNQVVVLFFHFLRNFQTVFHNGCTYVHSNQQGTRVFFLSTSSPTFVICVLFDDSHSNQCEVVFHHRSITTEVLSQTNAHALTCISLIISDAEHLFMCLLVTCISSLEKCIQFICPFFKSLFSYVELNELLHILDINPLLVTSFANLSSHSVCCIFLTLMASFAVQKL